MMLSDKDEDRIERHLRGELPAFGAPEAQSSPEVLAHVLGRLAHAAEAEPTGDGAENAVLARAVRWAATAPADDWSAVLAPDASAALRPWSALSRHPLDEVWPIFANALELDAVLRIDGRIRMALVPDARTPIDTRPFARRLWRLSQDLSPVGFWDVGLSEAQLGQWPFARFALSPEERLAWARGLAQVASSAPWGAAPTRLALSAMFHLLGAEPPRMGQLGPVQRLTEALDAGFEEPRGRAEMRAARSAEVDDAELDPHDPYGSDDDDAYDDDGQESDRQESDGQESDGQESDGRESARVDSDRREVAAAPQANAGVTTEVADGVRASSVASRPASSVLAQDPPSEGGPPDRTSAEGGTVPTLGADRLGWTDGLSDDLFSEARPAESPSAPSAAETDGATERPASSEPPIERARDRFGERTQERVGTEPYAAEPRLTPPNRIARIAAKKDILAEIDVGGEIQATPRLPKDAAIGRAHEAMAQLRDAFDQAVSVGAPPAQPEFLALPETLAALNEAVWLPAEDLKHAFGFDTAWAVRQLRAIDPKFEGDAPHEEAPAEVRRFWMRLSAPTAKAPYFNDPTAFFAHAAGWLAAHTRLRSGFLGFFNLQASAVSLGRQSGASARAPETRFLYPDRSEADLLENGSPDPVKVGRRIDRLLLLLLVLEADDGAARDDAPIDRAWRSALSISPEQAALLRVPYDRFYNPLLAPHLKTEPRMALAFVRAVNLSGFHASEAQDASGYGWADFRRNANTIYTRWARSVAVRDDPST